MFRGWFPSASVRMEITWRPRPRESADSLRAWNVETGQIVASINQNFTDACFAAKGSVLVVALRNRITR